MEGQGELRTGLVRFAIDVTYDFVDHLWILFVQAELEWFRRVLLAASKNVVSASVTRNIQIYCPSPPFPQGRDCAQTEHAFGFSSSRYRRSRLGLSLRRTQRRRLGIVQYRQLNPGMLWQKVRPYRRPAAYSTQCQRRVTPLRISRVGRDVETRTTKKKIENTSDFYAKHMCLTLATHCGTKAEEQQQVKHGDEARSMLMKEPRSADLMLPDNSSM